MATVQQSHGVNADGGFLSIAKLSRTIRHAAQPLYRFRQFTRVEPGLGKNRNDTLNFDKISNVQTRGGKISELDLMPKTKFTITQGTLLIDEFGNSIDYTGKLESLAEFSISNMTAVVLRNDMANVLDIEVANQFKATDIKYVPTSLTGGVFETTLATVGSAQMSVQHVKDIVDGLKKGSFVSAGDGRPVPPFEGGDYMCIATVDALRGLKDDPEWENAALYGDPSRIFNGEVGRIHGCRFIESNNQDAITVQGANSIGEALFFGLDPVVEGVAIPEEIRGKLATDYGRDKGVAWYFLGGWQIVWTSLAVDGEQHIVHFTSA